MNKDKTKFVRDGLFAKNGDHVTFIPYKSIIQIYDIYEDCKKLKISVHWNNRGSRDSTFFTKPQELKDELINFHRELVNNWIQYHDKSNSLEEKIERLLSLAEIAPGAEEYNKVEERFQISKTQNDT